MAESLIKSVIKCPICLEAYTDPRMLPCLHSFCQKCLHSYIQSSATPSVQLFFTCPVCREEIRPPNPHQPAVEWSTQFRSNFIMSDLASCLNGSARMQENGHRSGELCMSCSNQTQYPREAEHFCLDCSQPYCATCLQVHTSIPSCRLHSIASIDDHQARELHQMQHQQCLKHPEEVLKMFCEDCGELLCPVCALLKHRQCSKLDSIPISASARRNLLQSSKKKLCATLTRAKLQQDKVQKEKEDMLRLVQENLRHIDDAYDSLLTKIKELKRWDLQQMHDIISSSQKHFNDHEEDMKKFIALLEDDFAKMQNKQTIRSDVQLLQEVKTGELQETDAHVHDLSTYLDKMGACCFQIPGLHKEKLEDILNEVENLSLDMCRSPDRIVCEGEHTYVNSSVDQGGTASFSAFTEVCPARSLGPTGDSEGGKVGYLHLALQEAGESSAAYPPLSLHFPPVDASVSGAASQNDTTFDSQRNPFSVVSVCKKPRPKIRPRNNSARRSVVGSVFSVKHPVVTAASSTNKSTSPKKNKSGFIFTSASSPSTIFTLPIRKSREASQNSTYCNINSNTLPIPKPRNADGSKMTLPKSAALTASDASEMLSQSENAFLTVKDHLTSHSLPHLASPKVDLPNAFSSAVPAKETCISLPQNVENAGFGPNRLAKSAPEVLRIETSHTSGCSPRVTAQVDTSPAVPTEKLFENSIGQLKSDKDNHPTKPESLKLRNIFKICPVSEGDLRPPIISDFAVMPDDRLAVVDRANNCVKLVQMTGEGQIQAGECLFVNLAMPHGICHMDAGVVAVVSHVAKTLQLVCLGSRPIGVQHTHNTCRGYTNVARLSSHTLAARFSLGVHILDVGGPALRLKAAIVNDENGKPLFQSPTSMCTTPDGKIVVLDAIKLEVSCWDQAGMQLWQAVHSRLNFPRSLCSMGLRRVYCLCDTCRFDCLATANGKLLHSVKLEVPSLKDVSTVAQDAWGRILINNLVEIVCFDWV